MSTLTVTPTLAALGASGNIHARSQSRLTVPMQQGEESGSQNGEEAAEISDPEIEGESLAARKQRLANETLPRARPVSIAFSAELLSQFGETDPPIAASESKDKGKATGLGKSPVSPSIEVPEEEETLGQRRRRLQLEREAREQEMGPGGAAGRPNGTHGRNPSYGSTAMLDVVNPVTKRLSMADMLGAHPFDRAQGRVDPREQERARREAEVVRMQQEQESKLAMLRAQMPNNLVNPVFGARNGGYMGGRFNDGLGGGFAAGNGVSLGYGNTTNFPTQQPMYQQQYQQQRAAVPGGGYAGGYVAPNPYGMQMNVYGNMASPVYGSYQMMPSPAQQAGHVDMVERWRQNVMP